MPINRRIVVMRNALVGHVTALILLLAQSLPGALPSVVERIQFKGGKIYVWPGAELLMAPDELTLPFSIIVQTNGSFTVKGGKARMLQEGEILRADGMLTKPDGSITPVMDHVSLNRGRVMLMKDGDISELTSILRLGDGTIIAPDGKITPGTGSPRRLMDGELFRLEGGSLPTRDTVTMQGGRVSVQKDGAKLNVEPGRSLTMNDGTKVFGDGTIVKFNGERTVVSEGQVLTLDGVITRPR